MSQTKFLLASASPRRRELLRLLNVPYNVCSTDVDETPRVDETASALVVRLSRAKADAARAQYPDATIIACDTIVDLDGMILGKPRDKDQANAMLHALRGRAHSVYGGITVSNSHHTESQVTCTRVWMRDYSDAEIEAYIATGDPLDKAAAYAVQHQIFRPAAHIEGCFANIMGLALCHLYEMLARKNPMPAPALNCHQHPENNCTVARLVAAGKIAGA